MERLSNGASRADATELMKLLMPLLPESLHQHIKSFELRGLRNYSIKIPVGPSVIREVKGIWMDAMKSKTVVGPNQCELYVTIENHLSSVCDIPSWGSCMSSSRPNALISAVASELCGPLIFVFTMSHPTVLLLWWLLSVLPTRWSGLVVVVLSLASRTKLSRPRSPIFDERDWR